MFRSFFADKQWALWAYVGAALILFVTWYQVQVDVRINEWFGDFYNAVQETLTNPNSVTFEEYLQKCLTFIKIAGVYIIVAVLLEFFTSHYIFRWRTAMNNYYVKHWDKVRHIEGASQRVQEDAMRFARIVESMGVSFMSSLMTLFAFLPLLWGLSKHITVLPWVGEVNNSLVYLALLSAIFGTVVLAAVGWRLPGLEFNNQKVEAAYRKELVYGEDHSERARPQTLGELFHHVRLNYFKLYLNYLYFNLVKWSYLQFSVIVPLVALGPTIVAGAITFGVMQQIVRAFNRVEQSFQFLVYSWATIVELMSIYKRLKAFEKEITARES